MEKTPFQKATDNIKTQQFRDALKKLCDEAQANGLNRNHVSDELLSYATSIQFKNIVGGKHWIESAIETLQVQKPLFENMLVALRKTVDAINNKEIH